MDDVFATASLVQIVDVYMDSFFVHLTQPYDFK